MISEKTITLCQKIMADFSESSGLYPPRENPRRYLWTDAFALCNFLELHKFTNELRYLDLAHKLVDQVHFTLGRHRDDDSRNGWISGLNEEDGKKNPTAGGLRIGKPLNERGENEAYDDQLEWDRDGQYFHYLTKWMHALTQFATYQSNSGYLLKAKELAKKSFDRFSYDLGIGLPKLMYWKMSIDLSRPQLSAMGQHDPLDGYLTFHHLNSISLEKKEKDRDLNLNEEIKDLQDICVDQDWMTDDPLGLGSLLTDSLKLTLLLKSGHFQDSFLLKNLYETALVGLKRYARSDQLKYPAEYRLAFRELGLAIGLKSVSRAKSIIEKHLQEKIENVQELYKIMADLSSFEHLADQIEKTWLESKNHQLRNWQEHLDINRVMLVTYLIPDGFIMI